MADYHPYRYHLPIRRPELVRLLGDSGFEQIETRAIIFVWKNIPDLLFPLARCSEAVMERLPLVNRLGSTIVLNAHKPL